MAADEKALKAFLYRNLYRHPSVMSVREGAERIVLDLFGGSGSTLIAAHKTGRRANLCELDPLYCDRIIRRCDLKSEIARVIDYCGRMPRDAKSTH